MISYLAHSFQPLSAHFTLRSPQPHPRPTLVLTQTAYLQRHPHFPRSHSTIARPAPSSRQDPRAPGHRVQDIFRRCSLDPHWQPVHRPGYVPLQETPVPIPDSAPQTPPLGAPTTWRQAGPTQRGATRPRQPPLPRSAPCPGARVQVKTILRGLECGGRLSGGLYRLGGP